MSLLCVGLSHRSAPLPLLEKAVLAPGDVPKLLHELAQGEHVHEQMVLSTCNRVEVYAEVTKFHAGLHEVSELLSRSADTVIEAFSPHLYVHYEDRAVQHLFTVAAGLDSMVVGETQVLGQLRDAYRQAREQRCVGRSLGSLAPAALRAGKRVRTETDIDRTGRSLVGVGLGLAGDALGGLAGRRAVVVGAGSMAALAGNELHRRGVGRLTVANRTRPAAERLAGTLGGTAAGLGELAGLVRTADLVVCCTGATGVLLTADTVAEGMAGRAGLPLFVLDLALPRDVDPAVRELAGVTVADLTALAAALDDTERSRHVDAARRIVAEEVGRYLAGQRSARVAPTVAALRSKAAEVVQAELLRLAGRLPELDSRAREEVAVTVHRVVDKLLHAPTVRVKQLAEGPGGDAYAEALRELFGLDPAAPEAVTRADVAVEETGPGTGDGR